MWIVKSEENGKYLHSFDHAVFGKVVPTWTEYQMFAWRFADRNVASCIAVKLGEFDTCLLKLKGTPHKSDGGPT